MNETSQENIEVESTEQTVKIDKPELDQTQKVALVEALLFACGEPLTVELIAQVTGLTEDEIQDASVDIRERLSSPASGVELVCVAESFQLRTKAIFGPYIRELKTGGPRKLSAPALETLSIVAYRQPIVKSDVEKIRGVDATPTLKTLLDRNLIRIIGHQASVGQPALYGTTDEFLKLFGLKSLSELPTLRDLSELERDPGEEVSEEMTEENIQFESSEESSVLEEAVTV